jgi:hypothetical protein
LPVLRRSRWILLAARVIRRAMPLRTRAILAALGAGRDPGQDGIVVL